MVMAKQKNGLKKSVSRPAKKNQKATQIVTLRMLIMVLADIIGIAVVCAIHGEARTETTFVNSVRVPMMVVFGVLSAAAAVFFALTLAKKKDVSKWIVTPLMVLCVALFCLLVCVVYTKVQTGAIILASVIGTVLFLVYCLYMHIFYR